jgi:hypothetical protein
MLGGLQQCTTQIKNYENWSIGLEREDTEPGSIMTLHYNLSASRHKSKQVMTPTCCILPDRWQVPQWYAATGMETSKKSAWWRNLHLEYRTLDITRHDKQLLICTYDKTSIHYG